MNAVDILQAVKVRGGEVRASPIGIEYRPLGVVTPRELSWLAGHRRAVEAALSAPDPADPGAARRWIRYALGLWPMHVGVTPAGEVVWIGLTHRVRPPVTAHDRGGLVHAGR